MTVCDRCGAKPDGTHQKRVESVKLNIDIDQDSVLVPDLCVACRGQLIQLVKEWLGDQ